MNHEIYNEIFLTWDELIEIHRQQIELFNGQDGFIDQDSVVLALYQPMYSSIYAENGAGPDLADLAAEYFWRLIAVPGFCDGNKRTGTNAALVFLQKNGWRLDVAADELFDVAKAVAVGQLDKNTLSDRLREHLLEIN